MKAARVVWSFFPLFILAALLLALAGVAKAQVTTVGGKPASTAATVPLKVTADGAVVTAGAATYVKNGAPSFAVSVTTSPTVVAGLTAGGCYRLACGATVYWRTWATGAIPSASTTDNPFYGPAVETPFCLQATDTQIAFVTSSGTASCVGTALSRTP